MADTKISALPSGAPAQAGDEYVIARSGANYKLTGTNLLGLVTSTANTFTADQTFGVANATTLDATNVEVTNLKAKDGTAAATISNSTGVISVSTKVEYADGTAAAPTVTNTGDTDTGVYFPAANEVAVTTGGTVAAGFNSNGLFFRNRIINGDMRIDQRNAGASGTANGYTVDRFAYFGSQASKGTWQQNAASVTPPSGYVNYLGFTSSSAYTVGASEEFELYQAIEGTNVADLGWGAAGALTVTLSFWVRSSLTGTFGGALQNTNGTRSYPFSYTISAANTWEYKTITVAGDTTGTWLKTTGLGLAVYFGLGVGSTKSGTAGAWAGAYYTSATSATSVVGTNGATFYITGVQLETGSVATPFERRPFGTELMLCQRYCYGSKDDGDGNSLFGYGMCFSATNGNIGIQFPVTMRASPSTLTTAGTFNVWNSTGGAVATTSISLSAVTSQTVGSIAFTTAGSLVAGNITGLYAGATTSQLVISAEL